MPNLRAVKMMYVLLKYLHFIGILALFSSIALEHTLLKREMNSAEFARLSTIDLVYGVSAVLVLLAGLVLWLVVSKPSEFYSLNPVFHVKVSLFVLVGLISIYPTVYFLKNRKHSAPMISVPKSIIMAVRMELLLLLVIPLLAVLMAQGYGLA